MSYNAYGIGGPVISFHDGMSSPDPTYNPYDGTGHVILQSGTFPANDVALAQSGLIPGGTLSVRLAATASTPIVTFNGQAIQMYDLGLAPGSTFYHQYAGDISPYAGTSGELRFGSLRSTFWLDAISFSTSPIPEPSTWALLTLGSALSWCAARRRKK